MSMRLSGPRCAALVLFLGAAPCTLGWGAARAQVFARTDDTRVAAPEQRQRPRRWTAELQLGGAYLAGNVDHLALNGSLALSLRLSRRNELFIDGQASHSLFDGESKIDKDKGSLLYVLKVAPHLNFYVQSTHARNRFLSLKYRTSNGGGLCVHQARGRFSPVLASIGLAPEVEWWENDTREVSLRGAARVNVVLPLGGVSYGVDAILTPLLSDPRDYRLYVEVFGELKLRRDVLALRLTLSDEHDSRPPPGVRRNDLTLIPSLLVRLRD